MFVRLLIVVILLVAIFGGIFGWKGYQQQQAAARQGPPPPATVAYVTAKAERWQPELRAVGTLVATMGIDVTAEVSGVVRAISFESGQAVAAGDVLVRLDDAVDQADLQGLLAEQKLAEIKYRRLAKLVHDRAVSQSDVDEAKATLDNATAQVAAKQAVIEKKTIKAPFDGYLGIRTVNLGELVQPGAPLVPLQSLDPLYVDFALPERHLPSLGVGQRITVAGSAVPGRVFAGTIAAMNPGVDRATRTIKLRAVLANPEHLQRPGMFVEVGVQLPARTGVIALPQEAVSFAPYGDSVFVIEEREGQQTVQRQPITTGTVQGNAVEVVEGLHAGQRVVLAGQVKLRNGAAVRLDNAVVPGAGALGK